MEVQGFQDYIEKHCPSAVVRRSAKAGVGQPSGGEERRAAAASTDLFSFEKQVSGRLSIHRTGVLTL